MKVAVVGNICKRIEVRDNKKSKPEIAGSFISALTAARLGHDVTLISRVPDNTDVLSLLRKEKITLQKQSAWMETVYESIYTKSGKQTKVLSDAGPIVKAVPGNYDVVLISSYYGYVNSDVIKTLKTPENIVCLDTQSYTKHRGADGMLLNKPWLDKEKYLKHVDILSLNINDLFYLTGKVSLNSANDLLKFGPKLVVLTVKDQCNYIFYDKTYLKMPFYKVKTALPSKKGLGEVYDTCFALKFAETKDPKEAGFYAEAATSLVVERDAVKKPVGPAEVKARFKLMKDIFLA
jgi:sugar/nucleoside kinase (ribokinase family)